MKIYVFVFGVLASIWLQVIVQAADAPAKPVKSKFVPRPIPGVSFLEDQGAKQITPPFLRAIDDGGNGKKSEQASARIGVIRRGDASVGFRETNADVNSRKLDPQTESGNGKVLGDGEIRIWPSNQHPPRGSESK
jgi:hypothetical protein